MMGSLGGEGGGFLLQCFEVENHLERNRSMKKKKGRREKNSG